MNGIAVRSVTLVSMPRTGSDPIHGAQHRAVKIWDSIICTAECPARVFHAREDARFVIETALIQRRTSSLALRSARSLWGRPFVRIQFHVFKNQRRRDEFELGALRPGASERRLTMVRGWIVETPGQTTKPRISE